MDAAEYHIRRLTADDRPEAAAFLAGHADSSMFLRDGIHRGDLEQVGSDKPVYAGAFRSSELRGIVAHFGGGRMVVQSPVAASDLALWTMRESRRTVSAIFGPPSQVEEAIRGLGMEDRARQFVALEILYALKLCDLREPAGLQSGAVRARRTEDEDLQMLADWWSAYSLETMNEPDTPANRAANAERIRTLHQGGHLFLLEDDGGPVATSAFNAALADTVQIGAVWTPPALRGRGYARAVVAGSLLLAAAAGVSRAVLFVDNAGAAARRAYEAIGFGEVGEYMILFFIAEPA